jgi:hypothetical protein
MQLVQLAREILDVRDSSEILYRSWLLTRLLEVSLDVSPAVAE